MHIYVRRLVALICLGHGGRTHCALTHILRLFFLVVTEGVLGIRPLYFSLYTYNHMGLFFFLMFGL